MKIAIRAWLLLAALCFVAGFGFIVATFTVSTEFAAIARPLVLRWYGGFIMVIGTGYVLIHHATTRDIAPGEAETQALAYCPPELKRAGYFFMILGVAAFFGFIWLVESHRIEQFIGELAIIGAFSILISAGTFPRLWSTHARLCRSDA